MLQGSSKVVDTIATIMGFVVCGASLAALALPLLVRYGLMPASRLTAWLESPVPQLSISEAGALILLLIVASWPFWRAKPAVYS